LTRGSAGRSTAVTPTAVSFRKFTLVASLLLAGSLLSSRAGDSPWKQDRLLVTFWCPPPANDTHLAAVAADGYNVTGTPEAGLDVARRHGLAAMLQDELLNPEVLDDPARRARLDALIDRVKGHPALLAYYLTDEPGAGAFAGWGRLVEYLRRRDPAHFAYINLFPTYANNAQLGTAGDTETAYREHLRRFVATVKPELISYDHYHFFQGRDGDQYFLNLAMIREAARDAGVPFLNIIQACTIEKVWRLVNPDELRFLVYTTLAYGGRGISYFLHWGPVSYGGLYQDGVRMPLADAVAGLNREINALSPPLMKLRSLGVYHSAPLPRGAQPVPDSSPVRPGADVPCVLGLFGTGTRPTAFLLANGRYDRETVVPLRFADEIRRLEEFDRRTGRWGSVDGWRRGQPWDAGLRPGDGRLFRWARR
jgi:hypothetical protein